MHVFVFLHSCWQQLLPLVGSFILIASLFKVRALIRELPKGSVRNKWAGLGFLTVFFFAGYLIYAGFEYVGANMHADLLVPAIFLAGAVFVFLIFNLSYTTALALKRAEILEIENVTDSLTGVFNRRYLDQRMRDECMLSLRHKYDTSLIMLDIDFFKKVNDTLGHQAGDMILRQLGDLLKNTLRLTDVVTRYGGEEFLALLPQTTSEAAQHVAELLRQKVEEYSFNINSCGNALNQKQSKITVSLGVASFSDVVESVGYNEVCCRTIDFADQALYLAKKRGRNQVVRWLPATTIKKTSEGNSYFPSGCLVNTLDEPHMQQNCC